MADEFDRFLASSLGPDERPPDLRFVAAVQSLILVEDVLNRDRRKVIGDLLEQLAALFAVASAAWMVGRAPAIADLSSRYPTAALTILLGAFACLVAMFTRGSTDSMYIGPKRLAG